MFKDNKSQTTYTLSCDKIYSKYGKIVTIMDELRGLGCFESSFTMPVQHITFIGESKCGKTSLIDSLLGYDLLPRNVPTRRNLELKLVHNPDQLSPILEIEESSDQPPKRFTNMQQAKDAIKQLQEHANDQNISDKIKCSLITNTSADMIITDCMPIDDRNPMSFDLNKRFISDSQDLIILVMSAHHLTDQNKPIKEKWFKLIKETDFDLSRTICVFTQCDNVPTKYNFNKLKPFLSERNHELPLKNGFVCCKCNFSSGLSGQDLFHLERDYFSGHKVFQFMQINDYFTLDTLGEKITKYICETSNFKKNIVYMYQQLKDRIAYNEKELEKFGSDFIQFNAESKELYMQSLMNLFCETVDKIFSGQAEYEEDNVANTNLKKYYTDFLNNYISFLPSKKAKEDEIIQIIQQSEGAKIGGFPSGDVVYSLLDDHIETLRNEIKAYLDNVYLTVNSLFKNLINRTFGRFPKALNGIEELILGFLEQEFAKTKQIINNIAEMNFNYLYIDDQSASYQKLLKQTLLKNMPVDNVPNQNGQGNNNNRQNNMNNNNKNQQSQQNQQSQNMNMYQFKEEKDLSFFKFAKNKDSYYRSLADYVKALIDYYYAEMIRSLREYLPKATGNFYINSLKTNMRFHLLSYITKNPEFVQDLEEDQEQAAKRKYYIESTASLKNINKLISYDESLMKIIKSDSGGSRLDNIIQQQLKNDPIPQEKKVQTNQSKNEIAFGKVPKEKPNNFSGSAPGNQDQQQQKSQQSQKSTMANLFGKPSSDKSNNNNANNQQQQHPSNSNQGGLSVSTHGVKDQTGVDVKFKVDPTTGEVKDVQGNIDAAKAKDFYDKNKQYLPTAEQVKSGLKTAWNFMGKAANAVGNAMSENNKNQSNNAQGGQQQSQPKKDPLSTLFGTKK